mmetsp:Transcript_42011/g.48677  ORF Transcript_42011/g.48677 Transcript_42011/m.48677 type:complete len:275 (+) Transcript_42011:1839-2663(+)
MLDASSYFPFFSRSKDGSIYGMGSSTEWHNENKQGAFMINQYHKDAYDFGKKLKKLGRKIVLADEIDDDEKIKILREQGIDATKDDVVKRANDSDTDSDLDVNYDNSNSSLNFQYLDRKRTEREGAIKIQDQLFAQEVDFEMFEKKFWGKNKGRLRISAMNVWTEIFSVIKGGLQTDWYSFSRLGTSSVMSKKKYFRLKSSMDYLTPSEKNQVYWIYVKYEEWKNRNNMYDFMDVVKHVMYHSRFYNKSKIDYLVIDEVQDLTPLTIQLLITAT